ncbi:MAG: nitroreductase [Acidimicrobiia bacterium]|nr:MAG: nitroreductase [Acidimicrobiia bacterium]
MEFWEVVRRRRMVRSYRPDPVDRATIARIVEAGVRAPSAGFTQAQHFVVITEPRTRRAVAELAGEGRYVARGYPPWISRAPVHIIVCVSPDEYRKRYSQPDKRGSDPDTWPVPYWWVDAGASLEAILLAAVDAGLAAGFLGVHRLAGVRELLGIPPEVVPIGVVTVGMPDVERPTRPRERKAGRVHWERWEGTG